MLTCAVIGCGPAGMSAISTLRRQGLLVTGFELAPMPGGIWNSCGLSSFTPRGVLSPIYPSMRCVLPKELMAFSDKNFPYSAPHFPHHSVVTKYLHDYAESRGVPCVTRFNTKVESVRYDPERKCWRLISVNVVTHDTMEWMFDRVLVCTGQHHAVRVPEYDAVLKAFSQAGGEVMHSAYCKNLRDAKRKNVVVVGDGVGAYDMCRELLRNGAKSVTHSTLLKTSGMLSFQSDAASKPKISFGDSIRTSGSTSLSSFLASMPFLRNQEHRANEILSKWLRFENRFVLNVPRVGAIVGCEGRSLLVREDPSNASRKRATEVLDAALRRDNAAAAGDAIAKEAKLAVDTKADDDEDDPDRRVVLQNPKDDLEERNLKMVDSVDWIVFATGYHLQYPFLSAEIRAEVEGKKTLRLGDSSLSPEAQKSMRQDDCDDGFAGRRGLFLGTVYAKNPSIAFIGSQRDLLPPFILFEAQTQLAAGVFTGRNQRVLGEVIRSPFGHGEEAAEWDASAVASRLERIEDNVLEQHPQLRNLYSPHGVGLSSGVYHRVLQEHSGCIPTPYALLLAKRWWNFVASRLVHTYHKLRSLAPLKRKQQHVLVSNDV